MTAAARMPADETPRGLENADPPHDDAAEESVLGAMMLSPVAVIQCSEVLTVDDFYRPANATIFSTILELEVAGLPSDSVTLTGALREKGELLRVGNASYISDLPDRVPSAANGAYYADIVARQAVRRRLLTAGLRAAQIALGHGEVEANVDLALAGMGEVLRPSAVAGAETVEDVLAEILDVAEHGQPDDASRARFGHPDLDEVTLGFKPGQLVLVGGSPGVGKSVALADLARNAAIRQKIPTLLFQLEMSTQECVTRLLAAEARIDMGHLQTGTLDDTEWARLANHQGPLIDAPLSIVAAPSQTIASIRRTCMQMQKRGDLGLVLIDYLQLIQGMASNESRQEFVGRLARELKILAKELGVPVVCAVQVNRAGSKRSDPRPRLFDLRESGGLEANADIVILVWREDQHDPDSGRVGVVDLIVAKNRNGVPKTVALSWQGHYSRMYAMAPEDAQPASTGTDPDQAERLVGLTLFCDDDAPDERYR